MYERATVVINTSGLCFRKRPDLKNSCGRQVAIEDCAVPNKIPSGVNTDVHMVPHRWEGGREGGRVMHRLLHTAGLTLKPHRFKLPHFPLSKRGEKKRDSFDFWENLSDGLTKQPTCTYHRNNSRQCYWNLLQQLSFSRWSVLHRSCSGLLFSANVCLIAGTSTERTSQHQEHSLKRLFSLTFPSPSPRNAQLFLFFF